MISELGVCCDRANNERWVLGHDILIANSKIAGRNQKVLNPQNPLGLENHIMYSLFGRLQSARLQESTPWEADYVFSFRSTTASPIVRAHQVVVHTYDNFFFHFKVYIWNSMLGFPRDFILGLWGMDARGLPFHIGGSALYWEFYIQDSVDTSIFGIYFKIRPGATFGIAH